MRNPQPLNILPEENAPTILWAHLRSRQIYADEITKALLRFTALTPQAFDMINRALDLPHGRTLTLRIGSGIGYRVAYQDRRGYLVEAIVNCQDDRFVFPMYIAVKVGIELQPSDHRPDCRLGECDCPYIDFEEYAFIVNDSQHFADVCDFIQRARGERPAT